MKKITEDGEIVDVVTHEVIARTPIYFKTPWNHDTDHEARSSALTCMDPSRTQQQFAKEADINNILAQFMKTGELNLIGSPVYQAVAEEYDLQDNIVTQYERDAAWNALSPEVRNTLKDPKTFADYVDHCVQVGDLKPLQDLGLAPKPPEAVPDPSSSLGGSVAPGSANGA